MLRRWHGLLNIVIYIIYSLYILVLIQSRRKRGGKHWVHEVKQLLLFFYKIVNKEAPDYLYELVPHLVEANVNYNLRNSHNIHIPFNRLSVYQNSYFPCTIQAWNSLDLTIRNLPTLSSFKLKLQQILYTKRRNPQYHSIGDHFLNVLHSRMRNKCSALNADLYHANVIVNYNCLCG